MKKLAMSVLTVSALLWGTSYVSISNTITPTIDKLNSKPLVEGIYGTYGVWFPHSTYGSVFYEDVTYTRGCPCGGPWKEEFSDGISVVGGGGYSSYITLRIPRPAPGEIIYYGVEWGDCGCDLACNATAENCP